MDVLIAIDTDEMENLVFWNNHQQYQRMEFLGYIKIGSGNMFPQENCKGT